MVMIVQGGPDVFASVAFGPAHPSTLNFLQQQYHSVSDKLSEAGRVFMQRGQELFERYNGHKALQLAKAAIRASQHMFDEDRIEFHQNIGSMQQARSVMQRWIMACPDVRQQYHQQRCDGYSDTYIDMHPGQIGMSHYDYRKVMDGVIQDDSEESDWVRRTCYTDAVEEGDVDLSVSDKADILSLWDLIKPMMKPGKEDPTSPYCSTL